MLGLLSFQLLLLAKTVSSYTTQISISSMYNNDQMIGMMEDMFNKCKKDPGSSDVCTTFKGLDNVLFTDGTNINKVIEKVPTNNDVLQIFGRRRRSPPESAPGRRTAPAGRASFSPLPRRESGRCPAPFRRWSPGPAPG